MNYIDFFKAVNSSSIQNAYLMHGEEEYVKERGLERLCALIDEALHDLNVQKLSTSAAQEIIAACETLPFMSDIRLVICSTLPTSDDAAKLAKYLPAMPRSTLLVFFIRSKADAKNAVLRYLEPKGQVVEFIRLDANDAAKWAYAETRKRGAVMDVAVARHLIAMTGTDIATVSNELNKAVDYVGQGGVITREVLNACVTRNVEYRVFDMLDYFVAGKRSEGLRALDSILRESNAIQTAGFLASRFKVMLTARQLLDKKLARPEIIKRMGGSAYAAGRALDAAKRFTAAELVQAAGAFADVGWLQVSGRMRDRQALELAILKHMPKS